MCLVSLLNHGPMLNGVLGALLATEVVSGILCIADVFSWSL